LFPLAEFCTTDRQTDRQTVLEHKYLTKYEKKVSWHLRLTARVIHDTPCRNKHHCPYNDKLLAGALICASDKLLKSLKNYPLTSCIINYTQTLS